MCDAGKLCAEVARKYAAGRYHTEAARLQAIEDFTYGWTVYVTKNIDRLQAWELATQYASKKYAHEEDFHHGREDALVGWNRAEQFRARTYR